MDIKNLAHIMLVRKYGFLGAAAIAVSEKVTNGIKEAKERVETERAQQKPPQPKAKKKRTTQSKEMQNGPNVDWNKSRVVSPEDIELKQKLKEQREAERLAIKEAQADAAERRRKKEELAAAEKAWKEENERRRRVRQMMGIGEYAKRK